MLKTSATDEGSRRCPERGLKTYIAALLLAIVVAAPTPRVLALVDNKAKVDDFDAFPALVLQSNGFLPVANPALTDPMGDILSGKRIVRTVTAYRPVPWETDDTPCIAASGLNVCETTKKIVASNEFPFGTKLLINGKIWEVQDRMNKRFPDRLDLLFYTKEEVAAWGKRNVAVTVLN